MSDATREACPRCGETMQKGFCGVGMADVTTPMYWVEGELERAPLTRAARTEGRARHPVHAYRCGQCGFLAFVAPAE